MYLKGNPYATMPQTAFCLTTRWLFRRTVILLRAFILSCILGIRTKHTAGGKVYACVEYVVYNTSPVAKVERRDVICDSTMHGKAQALFGILRSWEKRATNYFCSNAIMRLQRHVR